DDGVVRAPRVEEVAVGIHAATVLHEEPLAPAAQGDVALRVRRQRPTGGVDDADLPARGGLAERAGADVVAGEARVADDDHADLGRAVHAARRGAESLLDEPPRARVHGLT